MKDVIIIGGGVSGLITAIQLARSGISVRLFERKKYPFHRVCGEYISRETIPFLQSLNLFPDLFNPPIIKRLQLTSVNGKSSVVPLDLGGFGISRFSFDHWLSQEAEKAGVEIVQQTDILDLQFREERFFVSSHHKTYETDIVVGAFGKRSKIDKVMDREFIQKKSPYAGVKYHINYDFPQDLIALHNFRDGYCGISRVENNITNLCYLTHRQNIREAGGIKEMEEKIMFENPYIKKIFREAHFIFGPETINEISFESKKPVENHVLMCGDAAGMITPLCGNGMAMGIHASKLLAEVLMPYCKGAYSRTTLEKRYAKAWNEKFAGRLWAGRQIQNLFGSPRMSNMAVYISNHIKPVTRFLISKTHGKPF